MSLDAMLGPHPDPEPAPYVDPERPRGIDPRPSGGDRTFVAGITSVALSVVVIVGAIGVFLGYQIFPTFHRYGLHFLTTSGFDPERGTIGILAPIVGTIEIAVMALLIAFPLALLSALFITEYAPLRVRATLVALLDLLAAVPSIVWAAWGLYFLVPNITFVSRWLNQWFGWLPFFSVRHADPHAADFVQKVYFQSGFSAAVVVSLMVMPLAASVMRGVFTQTPIGEREAAAALGATRWGVIRTVVLPFGRGGIIGGTMLGLGRALGETIAVLYTASVAFDLKIRVLENGTITISSLIGNYFGDATPAQISALLAAGFVLFLMTLGVNTLAAIVVNRSRSGAEVAL